MKNKGIVLIPVTVLGLAGLAALAYFIFRKKGIVVETTKTETTAKTEDQLPIQKENDGVFIDTTPVDIVPDAIIFDMGVPDLAEQERLADISKEGQIERIRLARLERQRLAELEEPEIDMMLVAKKMQAAMGFQAANTLLGVLGNGLSNMSDQNNVAGWDAYVQENYPAFANDIIAYKNQVGVAQTIQTFIIISNM